MGTNYYWIKPVKEYSKAWPDQRFEFNVEECDDDLSGDVHIHIGKRSAGGLYCKHCGVTINRYGSKHIHHDGPDVSLLFGNKNDSDEIKESKLAEYERQKKEFYFDACPGCGTPFEYDEKNERIIYICTFTWTMMRHKDIIKELADKGYDKDIIVNEYGEKYTAKEFIERVLESCYVQYQDAEEFW